MKSTYILFLILFYIFSIDASAFSSEVYLKNGDRLTGEITEENKDTLSIKTEAMGVILVDKRFIERVKDPEKEVFREGGEEDRELIWDRKISAGYNDSSGNTETSQLSVSLFINRKIMHVNEVTLKGNIYYSSSDKKMDAQKWYSMGRYAFSFGRDKHWYNLYKLELEHDRFANIDYRIIPSAGAGYWFYDTAELKVMAEAAMGLERTEFRDVTEDSDEAVFIPRAFFEKSLYNSSRLTQDLTFYLMPGDIGDYRLRSETLFNTPLSEKLSLNLSVTDDYNSEPANNSKNNDLRFMSGLTYSF